MPFRKYSFSSGRKRSKIFLFTLVFLYRLHPSTLKLLKAMKTTGTWDCACVNITRPSANLDRCSDLDWNRWNVKSLHFHLSRLKRSKTMKITGTWDCACVNITRLSAIFNRCFDLDWNRWDMTLFTSPFSKSPRCHLPTTTHTFETVFESLRLHRHF